MIVFSSLQIRRGVRVLLDNATATINPGQKVGLVGKNGCGKSTLLALLKNEISADGGSYTFPGSWQLAWVNQETPALPQAALEYVIDGDREYRQLEAQLHDANERNDGHAIATIHGKLDAIDAWSIRSRAASLLHGLGFSNEQLERPVSDFSGGWRMRLNLAQALICRSDLLLLDEPTNHLDAESVAWLERFLHDFEGTVVAITHDRYFLDNVAGWILELDRGHGIPYEGNYSGWLEAKSERLAQESKQQSAHEKAMKEELEWVRKGAKARQAKSKARLQRFEEMQSQEFQKRSETNEIYIPAGPRLGDKVIDFHNVSKSFGDRVLIDDLSFSIPKGAIVGVIGGNGAGKSTLLRMITGKEQPDSGTIEIGETVQIASVEQSRDMLDGSKTVWEQISDGFDMIKVGNYEVPSRGYVGRFNFKGADQQKFVKDLSGGERGRLHLALTLKQGGNVLLLDEPSNDLDVETLRALEEALLDFPGAAIVISHDRWFLDRIATHILSYEDDGKVNFFEGNYSEFEADRKKRLGDAAAQPHRVRYKKLAQ